MLSYYRFKKKHFYRVLCNVLSRIVAPLWHSSYLAASPPSYDSLFGRMREARKVSKDIFDFFKNILYLLLGTSK